MPLRPAASDAGLGCGCPCPVLGLVLAGGAMASSSGSKPLAELLTSAALVSAVAYLVYRRLSGKGRLACSNAAQADTHLKMVADVPTMVFGDSQVYRDGLSGRLGELTRSVQQEFEQNEGGKYVQELDYVLGTARQQYPGRDYGGGTKGSAPSSDLIETYTRDLGHDEWTIEHFWEAQPAKLRGDRRWADRNSPGGSPNELTELEVVMLRCWTGPVFKSWNFFLRHGPGAVVCCTSRPYHEHHKNNLVFCARDGEPNVCVGCGKRRDEHFEQQLASWSTCITILYSGITKVATAARPTTVYRGVNEKRIKLPQSFFDASDSGDFAGGVELAAMATTTDRKVAEEFSGNVKGSIFEIAFDRASRGADLQFLSQYPAEKEFLYPPGTELTCQGVRVEGGKRVLRLQATYNPDTLLMTRASAIRSLEQVPEDASVGSPDVRRARGSHGGRGGAGGGGEARGGRRGSRGAAREVVGAFDPLRPSHSASMGSRRESSSEFEPIEELSAWDLEPETSEASGAGAADAEPRAELSAGELRQEEAVDTAS